MSVRTEDLPPTLRDAFVRLRDGLVGLLGRDVIALWAHGAAVLPDRPEQLGDVDTHGVLSRPVDPNTAGAIEELHGSIARDAGIEWDAFYISESDVAGVEAPRHLIRQQFVDSAWALHRAHWLAGRVVVLRGPEPSALVWPPSWAELEAALQKELEHIEGLLSEGRDDSGHAAFMVWNACRILYSLETRDVVVSKREAASWALEHLPDAWHVAIRAAGRVYDRRVGEGDADVLRACLDDIVSVTGERFGE